MKLQALIPALITAAFLSTTFGSVSYAETLYTGPDSGVYDAAVVCQQAAANPTKAPLLLAVCNAFVDTVAYTELLDTFERKDWKKYDAADGCRRASTKPTKRPRLLSVCNALSGTVITETPVAAPRPAASPESPTRSRDTGSQKKEGGNPCVVNGVTFCDEEFGP